MSRVQRFVHALLEREGAAVEPIEPEGLEVLAPPALQRALELPEWSRLGFGAEVPAGARRVSLESDWLDRLERLIGERGRWAVRRLAVDNPPPGHPERVLEHALVLVNAPWRLEGMGAAWTRYQIHTLRYTAHSDEQRDGLLRIGFNLASGATLDPLLEPLLAYLDGTPEAAAESAVPDEGLPPRWPASRITEVLGRSLEPRLAHQLQPFFASMRRRYARDLERLHDYYGDLRDEAAARAARASRDDPGGSGTLEARLDAIAGEYRDKVADLREKYAVRVEVRWVQTLELVAPVQRLQVLVRRRKGERRIFLDWSPIARRLEQAPCEHAYTPDGPREVCDAALHLVGPAAHGPCPACEVRYCRACHPRGCPRCGGRARRPEQTPLLLGAS